MVEGMDHTQFLKAKKERVDLGSGSNPRPGFVSVDKYPSMNPDIICDIEKGLPFEDNSMVHVNCSHILEHIKDLIGLMNEIYRICKPNAIVDIRVPYATSFLTHMDPTHVRYFTEETFTFFTGSEPADYGIRCKFEIESITLNYFPDVKDKFADNLEFARLHYWNVVADMKIRLRSIK